MSQHKSQTAEVPRPEDGSAFFSPGVVLQETRDTPAQRSLVMQGLVMAILVGMIVFFGIAGARMRTTIDQLAAAPPPEPVIVVQQIEDPVFASRSIVNETVKAMVISGRSEDVYLFYDRFTKSREITYTLVNTALLSGIPINLLFGLVQWESNYNPRALNVNGGSSDHGLMQLNSITFSSLTEDDFYNPVTNIRHGSNYLEARFKEFGSWEAAVIAYNGGNTELVKGTTVRHLVNVLENEREYDRAFVEAFGK